MAIDLDQNVVNYYPKIPKCTLNKMTDILRNRYVPPHRKAPKFAPISEKLGPIFLKNRLDHRVLTCTLAHNRDYSVVSLSILHTSEE